VNQRLRGRLELASGYCAGQHLELPMSGKTLSDLSEKMREIDITMLMTRTTDGSIAGRPMSNNGDVDYDGDSYYFTWDDSRMVADIEADRTVSLAFQGEDMFMVTVQGKGTIIRKRAEFEAHWTPDLDEWSRTGSTPMEW
jgi:general stress protein 26